MRFKDIDIRAGRGFASSISRVAVAAQLAHVGIFNPAASGVQIEILACNFNGAGTVLGGFRNATLTNGVGFGANLLAGGAAANGAAQQDSNVANLITSTHFEWFSAADYVEFARPAILIPGHAFVIRNSTVNANLNGSFWWIERAG